jgi:hypothetical protein
MESAGINATLNADSLTPSASPLIFDAHPTRNPSPDLSLGEKKGKEGCINFVSCVLNIFNLVPQQKQLYQLEL